MDGSTGQNGDGPTGTVLGWVERPTREMQESRERTSDPTGTTISWAPKWGSEQFCRNLSSKTN